MRRVPRAVRPLPAIGLTAIYALALTSSDPLDLAGGAVLAVVLLWGLDRFLRGLPQVEPGIGRRLRHLPPFAWAVLVEITRGTWLVTLVVLGLRPAASGFVKIPIGERSRAGVAAGAFAINLSPGEVLVDVDWDDGQMLVHVLDAADPDAVRARYAGFYERYQRRLIP